jgi:ferredoxin-type protein NapH
MWFQLGFAFLLPYLLVRFQQPELYFHYFWPLDFTALFPWQVEDWQASGRLGTFMVFWGLVLIAVATPVLTYFFGKRWYCSWVCGCGGLAETAGDPYRHLSDKSLRAWRSSGG